MLEKKGSGVVGLYTDRDLIRSDIGYSVCRYTHETVLLDPSCLDFFRDSLLWRSLNHVKKSALV